MSARPLRLVVGLACLAAMAACREAEPPSHEEIVRADLAAILDLQGSPCGKVIGYSLDRRLDYRVECATGDVYRIHISAEGRVNVKEHDKQ